MDVMCVVCLRRRRKEGRKEGRKEERKEEKESSLFMPCRYMQMLLPQTHVAYERGACSADFDVTLWEISNIQALH
jgi:hypothetical protein